MSAAKKKYKDFLSVKSSVKPKIDLGSIVSFKRRLEDWDVDHDSVGVVMCYDEARMWGIEIVDPRNYDKGCNLQGAIATKKGIWSIESNLVAFGSYAEYEQWNANEGYLEYDGETGSLEEMTYLGKSRIDGSDIYVFGAYGTQGPMGTSGVMGVSPRGFSGTSGIASKNNYFNLTETDYLLTTLI